MRVGVAGPRACEGAFNLLVFFVCLHCARTVRVCACVSVCACSRACVSIIAFRNNFRFPVMIIIVTKNSDDSNCNINSNNYNSNIKVEAKPETYKADDKTAQ